MRASVLALVMLAVSSTAGPAATETFSRRSTELLRYECRQQTYLRDITLFANGTVRLREGISGARSLMLVELERDELAHAIERIREVDLSETDSSYQSGLGDEMESCKLRVDSKGIGEIQEVEFGRLEVSTLAINQLIEIAEELGKKTRALSDESREIPLDFQPRRGDILRRFDGLLFEVAYFSANGLEVELEGINQPMTLVVPIMDLTEVFDSIESREGD